MVDIHGTGSVDGSLSQRKGGGYAIEAAMMRSDALAASEKQSAEDLFEIWRAHLSNNRLHRRYYDGKNVLKDLGISIPPTLRNLEITVGWPKKAVTALASRVSFDGFSASDSSVDQELAAIVRDSNLKRKHRQALESELIAGCDFVTVSRGAAGEPAAIITTHSAEDAAAEWDERLGRVACGMVMLDYDDKAGDPTELALYTSDATIHVVLSGAGAVVERLPHQMGRPLMVALAYNPTESKPLGQSRISKPVRTITDCAVREAVRTEVSAEFFTSPQKYLLGVDADPYENQTKWEAYIGNIFTVGMTEDGTTPTFGQLSQGSMQPHTDYMRVLASRFSDETNVPVSQLGIVTDNPSSAEAINAATEPLVLDANRLIDDNGYAMCELARLALATSRGVPYSALSADELDISAHFGNPALPSVVSQADAMVKIASVVPNFANTEVFWEMLGLDEQQRGAVLSQMSASGSRSVLSSLMGGA